MLSKLTSLSLFPLDPPAGLCWTCSGISMSVLYWGAQNCTEPQLCSQSWGEGPTSWTFLDLLVALPLAQGAAGLQGPIHVESVQRLFFSKASPWSVIPILYLVYSAVPSQVQGFAFDFVELNEFLYLSEVLLKWSLLPCILQFGVICKLAESTFCPIIQAINKTTGQYWFQFWLLKN